MSGSGDAVSQDRFYYPPAVRRQQQLLQQQQQQQMSGGPQNLMALPRIPAGFSSSPPPWAVVPPPPVVLTNLDRFVESVTPLVQARFASEGSQKSWRGREPEYQLYYSLGDLWDSFGECSVYGVGVPLVLNGKELVVQYYVPFLSAIQLYVDPVNPPSRCSSSMDQAGTSRSPGMLAFEYIEKEQPYYRKPLADKISGLASEFPGLKNYRSCDLLPSSWLSVAWYPIYRIPVGPMLKDLDASFLTFHSLSTNSRWNGQPWGHGGGPMVPLAVFGLASYKLRGSILSPFGPLECRQENSLLQAADTWLRNLGVSHHDYDFFHSHHWRS